MNDLITRLERAEGPDRELDWAIHIRDGLLGVGMYGDHPRYTASIYAALTLVPEEWTVVTISQNDDKSWFAELREGFLTSYNRVALSPVKSSTPALALAAAALKARGV